MEGLKEKVKEVKALWRKRDKMEREYIGQVIPDMVGRYYCIKSNECGEVSYFKVLSAELDKKTFWIDIAVDGVSFDYIEETCTFIGVRHISDRDTHGLDGLLDFVEITQEEFEEKYAVWTKVVEMKKELGISID